MDDTTADELRSKFEALRGQYGSLHSRMLESRDMYNLNFESEVLPAGARARGFKAVIPRTARRSIDEAVDHVLYNPKVKVPVRPTDSNLMTEQEIAEKKRKAIAAWWRQITQRFNPLGDVRKWLFLDGMASIKQTLRLDLLPDKDDPKYRSLITKLGKSEFLWDVEVLNNEWVYPDPADHRNPGYVYVAYDITAEQARKRYPAYSHVWRDKDNYTKVRYMEYWSAPEFNADGTWESGRFIQWVDTEVVKQADNPYPYIPIAIDDAGYGTVYEGIEPEQKFVGLIDHSKSILIAQARQWSAMEAVAELTAFNPIVTRNMGDEKVSKLGVGPGEIWQLEGAEGDPEAEDIQPMIWPAIPVTVPQMIQLTDREVNSSTKAEMLGGVPQTGVDTATEADQNVRNASAKLQGPVAALERIAAKMTRWMLMDIELVLEAPVTLFGSGADDPADITLTPREINGYYDVFVQLRTTDEEALDLTRARFWGEMYRVLPFLSAWTAMEAGGISDDPLAEMIRRSGEDVFLSEEFRAIRVATGAQSFGQLMQYISQLTAEKKVTGGGGAASDQGLVTQTDINSPVEARVTSNALTDRDTNQAGAAYRA